MNQRSTHKEASLQRILAASAERLRKEGLSGAAIAPIMQDAGLTHGAFYAHFTSKDDLIVAALHHALTEHRSRWMGHATTESWPQRLIRLAKRYLTPRHRDDLADSCALAALVSDAARANPRFRHAYEEELNTSLRAICDAPETSVGSDPERFDEAIMVMALCIGGLSLARAVEEDVFSDRILAVCRNAAARIALREHQSGDSRDQDFKADITEEPMKSSPDLDRFPLKSYEKVRYADTDRQGHVNNAVFSTLLETGRVEVLYNPAQPLASPNCAFVIASLTLNFHSEITWPGRVEIGTRVATIGRSSVTLEQALFQEERCVATANTVIVQMNEATRRAQPLNDTAVTSLTNLMAPDATMTTTA
ncbi:MAG: TetR family transcriptional regulator [Chloroflexales bacterium]|nr:TetR family transcriptional regulator [Chloroflexales bacterium]